MKKFITILVAGVLLASCSSSNDKKDVNSMSIEERTVYYMDETVKAARSGNWERAYNITVEAEEWTEGLSRNDIRKIKDAGEKWQAKHEADMEFLQKNEDKIVKYKFESEVSEYFDRLLENVVDDHERNFFNAYDEFEAWYNSYNWEDSLEVENAIENWIEKNPQKYRKIIKWGDGYDFFFDRI